MDRAAPPIRDRAFQFACDIAVVALRVAPSSPGLRSILDQLVKSGTSVGANLEEAKAASSRREFVRVLEISLREARETHYWLRIAWRIKLASPDVVQPLIEEADEVIRILTAIVINTKKGSTP